MTDSQLSDRTSLILRTVVLTYIRTARPVGSNAISTALGLDVSSATVRNVLSVLDEEGYLTQPHTSAGRIPTDRAYRHFVDRVEDPNLSPDGNRAVTKFFRERSRELEALLDETSRLLALVSDQASLVVIPEPDAAKVRSIQVIDLQANVGLVVVVFSNGVVEKESIELPENCTPDSLQKVNQVLQQTFLEKTLVDVSPFSHEDPLTDAICQTVFTSLMERVRQPAGRLFVSGASRIMAENAFVEAPETAPRLFAFLEDQGIVVSTVQQVDRHEPTVLIGHENNVDELEHCSLVLAPFEMDGQTGTIGLLGPTRMDYQRSLAAVHKVSHQLTRVLSS